MSPTAPLQRCRARVFPRCPERVKSGLCDEHRKAEHKRRDDRRGTAAERGYGHRWRVARAHWLKRHPLCGECEKIPRVTRATVVDHIVPHKGDQVLFWDRENWQSLCKPHHDEKTARETFHQG